MSLTYTTYVQQLGNLMVVQNPTSNAEFQIFLPGCIDYAEQRMYRELDLLATKIVTYSGALTPNSRVFTYPSPAGGGSYLTIENLCTFTPPGVPPNSFPAPDLTRIQLQIASQQYIDTVFPADMSGTGVPRYFAPISNTYAILGPTPDAAYYMEVTGTVFPSPLSASNPTTFLTQNLPDLFMAASMVFASGYMRDFGAQADNPAMGAAWEAQYEKLMSSASVLELRKKYQSQGWQSQTPNPVATPPRS